jgi:tetratricopeptide (TPR) repeat protein
VPSIIGDSARRNVSQHETQHEAREDRQPLSSRAFIKLYYEWDRDGAEFRWAIDLNSNYANSHHWYPEYLSLVGRHESAILEAERGRELDPFSSIIHTWVGSRYFFADRYDLAIQQYRNVAELDPAFVPERLALGQAYERKGMFPQAIAELEAAVKLPAAAVYVAALAHALCVTGRKSEAVKLAHELEELVRRRYVSSFDVAISQLGLGDKDSTLPSLERALEERSPRLLFLNVDPRFEPLRSDARFGALIQRIGPFKCCRLARLNFSIECHLAENLDTSYAGGQVCAEQTNKHGGLFFGSRWDVGLNRVG